MRVRFLNGRLWFGWRALALTLAAGTAFLLAGADGAPAASRVAQDKMLYEVTVSFAGEQSLSSSAGDTYGSSRRTTVYVAKSLRPFVLSRTDSGPSDTYSFNTQLRGALSHVGTTESVNGNCMTRYSERSAVKFVQGYLLLNGRDPAPLLVDLWWVTGGGDPVTVRWKWEGPECPTKSVNPPTYGSSTLVFPKPARFTLPKVDLRGRFGKTFTLERRQELDRRSPGTHLCTGSLTASCRVSYRWTFTFVPVRKIETERWQVEVRGSDRWSWGRTATLGAGVWVDWTHRTEVAIEDGKVTKATGRVTVTRVTPFSDPEGVFRVSSRSKTYPPYVPKKAVKRGSLLELALWNDPGSMYRVDFVVTLSGPQALARMRAAGVPNADTAYQELVRRGPVDSVAIPLVPFSTRLVVRLAPSTYAPQTEAFSQQLPCKKGASAKECFLRRGGELVVVRSLS